MNPDRIIAVRNHKTVYRDGELCLKVFDGTYSKADVLAEANAQALAEETGLCIPPLLEVAVMDGKWTLVTQFVRGRTLEQIAAEHPQRKSDCIEWLVRLQCEVHSHTCQRLTTQQGRLAREIGRAELDGTTRTRLLDKLAALPRETALCHGDLSFSNILLSEDGRLCLIDWAHASQGSAATDAAESYLCFRLEGDPDGAEEYLTCFCEQSGISRKTVQDRLPIAAAARSARCNESGRRILRSWIAAADFD